MKNTLESTGNGISIAGSLTWVLAWMQQIEWLTLVGVIVAVGGFLMNMYYSRKKDARESEEIAIKISEADMQKRRHELEMKKLELEMKRLERENAKQD